jgi:heme A synthase
LITKDRIYVYVYALKSAKTNTTLASFTGSLTDGFKADSNLTSKISLNAYLFPEGTSLTDGYKSFRNLMNNAVRASAIVALWTNVGYLAAIYAGTVLISALILLIMHKRKTSINRNVNYLNTLFEAIVFALTPAVLALILGFFSYTYGIMILIGGVLIRVVWSSSKLMPPVTEEDNKPLYQARS